MPAKKGRGRKKELIADVEQEHVIDSTTEILSGNQINKTNVAEIEVKPTASKRGKTKKVNAAEVQAEEVQAVVVEKSKSRSKKTPIVVEIPEVDEDEDILPKKKINVEKTTVKRSGRKKVETVSETNGNNVEDEIKQNEVQNDFENGDLPTKEKKMPKEKSDELKKIKTKTKSTNSEHFSENVTKPKVDVEANVVVKKGRARKIATVEHIAGDETIKLNGDKIDDEPPAKIGRSSKTKAKNKMAESAAAEIEEEKNFKQKKKVDIKKSAPIKKSSGRRQAQNKISEENKTTEEEVEIEQMPKNVAGNKRKLFSQAVEEKTSKKSKTNATSTIYDNINFNLSKDYNLKICSWNVAGLRSWISKGCHDFVNFEKPDILCLQEIKCTEEQIPANARLQGYHPYWLCKPGGRNGVAIYSKIMPINVIYGLGEDDIDDESRIMTAEYEKFYLVCVYVPNSGRKLVTLPKRLRWNEIFHKYLVTLNKKKPVIICGDMNVAHNEIDLKNPKTNHKNAGFTKEERDDMTKLLSFGFVDTFRHFYPDTKDAYTFWTYMANARAKNVGWRLDYFLVSEKFIPKVVDNVMRSEVFGSDHCPITLFLNF